MPRRKNFLTATLVCEKCQSEFKEMKAVLRLTGERVRSEPPQEFWDSYEERLARRIETEETSRVDRESFREKLGRRINLVPKWAYQGAAAVVLIIIGVLIGRALFSPPVPGIQHTSQRPGLATHLQTEATVANRSQDYIQRSKLILLALVNFDPSLDDPYALDLTYQKQISKELVEEANFLKKELAGSDQERLENLIAGLEMILLQIANLESENDLDAIELVRDGINRRGILMEINLSDLRLSMKKGEQSMPPEQPSRKPKTT